MCQAQKRMDDRIAQLEYAVQMWDIDWPEQGAQELAGPDGPTSPVPQSGNHTPRTQEGNEGYEALDTALSQDHARTSVAPAPVSLSSPRDDRLGAAPEHGGTSEMHPVSAFVESSSVTRPVTFGDLFHFGTAEGGRSNVQTGAETFAANMSDADLALLHVPPEMRNRPVLQSSVHNSAPEGHNLPGPSAVGVVAATHDGLRIPGAGVLTDQNVSTGASGPGGHGMDGECYPQMPSHGLASAVELPVVAPPVITSEVASSHRHGRTIGSL